MSGFWKFNSSLLDEKDFRDQQELMWKRELMGAIIGGTPLRIELDPFLPTIVGYLAEQRRLKNANVERREIVGTLT